VEYLPYCFGTSILLAYQQEYLGNYLVSVTCDGATVMMGACRGVKKLLKDKFPTIILQHCATTG
jgi:hypothetical protein